MITERKTAVRQVQVSTPAGWDAGPGREVERGLPEGQPLSSPPIRFRRLHLLTGVILPFLSVAVEVFTGWSAEIYADPIPNRGLLLLALLAPMANLALWVRFCTGPRPPAWLVSRPGWLDWMSAVSSFVAVGYALLYLPITPVALILSLFGIGLLPLAPQFALFTAWRLRRALNEAYPNRRTGRVWALAAGAILAVNLPGAVTVAGLHLASSGDYSSRTREQGVKLLRWVGDRGQMLRACYANDGSWVQLWHAGLGREEARRIFYKVTGTPFDAVPQPRSASRFFFWDANQGGDKVGSVRLPGLTLSTSQIDGSVDPAAATSNLQWTMEFANQGPAQSEARAVVVLPAGGVVSRVTLWINGEPREAAFGGRAQVRQAYEAVVRARRDPLLVTTAGPGRVLVQCFPVPAGGTMKIRLGITSPVTGGRLELPHLAEQNFGAAAGAGAHTVWIDAGGAAIRRSLDDGALARPLELPALAAPADLAWTPDPNDASRHIERRWARAEKPGRLIVVVDGSESLRSFADEIEKQLAAAPPDLPVTRVLAGDHWSMPERFEPGDFAGGADNVPALLRAQTLALEGTRPVIVWLHGPQPVELSPAAALEQFWRRRPGRARLVAIELAAGPNHVLAALDGTVEVEPVKTNINNMFKTIIDPYVRPVFVRAAGVAGAGVRTGADLAQLWAASQANQLAAAGSASSAASIAAAYQVVTAVSGAVVLESQAQYETAGLRPGTPLEMASTPEPATLVLSLIGTLALLAARRLRCRTTG